MMGQIFLEGLFWVRGIVFHGKGPGASLFWIHICFSIKCLNSYFASDKGLYFACPSEDPYLIKVSYMYSLLIFPDIKHIE